MTKNEVKKMRDAALDKVMAAAHELEWLCNQVTAQCDAEYDTLGEKTPENSKQFNEILDRRYEARSAFAIIMLAKSDISFARKLY